MSGAGGEGGLPQLGVDLLQPGQALYPHPSPFGDGQGPHAAVGGEGVQHESHAAGTRLPAPAESHTAGTPTACTPHWMQGLFFTLQFPATLLFQKNNQISEQVWHVGMFPGIS